MKIAQRKKHAHQTQAGVSLIETIVAMGIFSLFLVSAMGFFIFLVRNQDAVLAEQEMHWQARRILNTISENVLMAQSIDFPDKNETDNRLVLSSGEEGARTESALYQNGTDLWLAEDGDLPERLSQNGVKVETVTFSNISFDEVETVRFEITLSSPQSFDESVTFFTTKQLP